MNKFDPKFPFYDDDSDYNTNANSYYKDLGRKTKLIKLLAKRIWEYDELLAEKLEEVETTLELYSNLLDGKINDFDNIILDKTEKWLSNNMEDILTQSIQTVWFGLTDDGYFMAVIPENWSEIDFDTSEDGHLILIN